MCQAKSEKFRNYFRHGSKRRNSQSLVTILIPAASGLNLYILRSKGNRPLLLGGGGETRIASGSVASKMNGQEHMGSGGCYTTLACILYHLMLHSQLPGHIKMNRAPKIRNSSACHASVFVCLGTSHAWRSSRGSGAFPGAESIREHIGTENVFRREKLNLRD